MCGFGLYSTILAHKILEGEQKAYAEWEKGMRIDDHHAMQILMWSCFNFFFLILCNFCMCFMSRTWLMPCCCVVCFCCTSMYVCVRLPTARRLCFAVGRNVKLKRSYASKYLLCVVNWAEAETLWVECERRVEILRSKFNKFRFCIFE